MKLSITLTISLPKAVADALSNEANGKAMDQSALAKEILTRHAMSGGHMSEQQNHEITLYRSLSRRVADAAERICESDGFQSDITARAVRACQSDQNWMRDYLEYIGSDDAFKNGNPKKRNINPDFGYQVKLRLKAQIVTENGKRRTAKAKGLVITDYSLLKR